MDGTLKLWDMSDDGNMIKTLRTNCTAFYGCCWSPDAMALATVGNYHSVRVVSVTTQLTVFFFSLKSSALPPLIGRQEGHPACEK